MQTFNGMAFVRTQTQHVMECAWRLQSRKRQLRKGYMTRAAIVMAALVTVSYTHLTLPTIYSV